MGQDAFLHNRKANAKVNTANDCSMPADGRDVESPRSGVRGLTEEGLGMRGWLPRVLPQGYLTLAAELLGGASIFITPFVVSWVYYIVTGHLLSFGGGR